MKDTSLDAYIGLNKSGKAVTQRAKIYKYLKGRKRGMTRQEISIATGIAINAVCGRVNELIKANVISELDRRACGITGSQAHTLKA